MVDHQRLAEARVIVEFAKHSTYAATREETGRGKESPDSVSFGMVDHQRLAEARVIVEFALGGERESAQTFAGFG